MATFNLKKGDRLPKLRAILEDGNEAPLDLTGATVTFRMRPRRGGMLKVNAPATVITAAVGLVEYAWAAADVDTEGLYDAEFVISLAGLPQTVPASGFTLVSIEAGLS